jgi:hypothetical protein
MQEWRWGARALVLGVLGATAGSGGVAGARQPAVALSTPLAPQHAAHRRLPPPLLMLRGGGEDSSSAMEEPFEFPNIPTDELSEDEQETLRQFRDVERKYENNELPPEARRQFDRWMEAQAVNLRRGASFRGTGGRARVRVCTRAFVRVCMLAWMHEGPTSLCAYSHTIFRTSLADRDAHEPRG